MGRTAGRSPEETRQGILDAATALIARRGISVSLTEIARAAGVSKGGLIYHFPSKEVLVHAGALALFERFRSAVEGAAADEPADEPGRLARAYIRVSFADASGSGDDLRELIAVAAQLMADDTVRDLADADGARWRADLAADGLPPAVVRMIVAATDGVSSAPLWGQILQADDRDALERELVAMTRVAQPPASGASVGRSADGAGGAARR